MPKFNTNFNNTATNVQNYKFLFEKLKSGLAQQLLARAINNVNTSSNTAANSSRIHDWIKKTDSIKAAISFMSTFLGKESSPIFAQKLFRTYRIIQLHSKLWSNRLIIKFGKHFLSMNSHLYSKRWLYSLVLLSFCDGTSSNSIKDSKSNFILQHSIEEKELSDHMNDLTFIHELTAATVVCPTCKDRLVVDKKLSNVEYCHCPDSTSAYNRKIDGYSWLPFVETPDLLVWRQPMEDKPGMFMYKVYGYYNDITPNDFLQTQLDLDYRKQWDNLVVKLDTVEEDKENHAAIVYWEMSWPKFFANRDYVYVRRYVVDQDKGTMVILNKAISYPKIPEVNGTVRVKEYWSVMHIKAVKGLNQPGVEFGLTYYDNPGVSLPAWLTNWAATVSIPDFLNKIRIAARERQKLGKNQIINFQELVSKSTEMESSSKFHESTQTKTEILSKFFKDNVLEQSTTLTEV